MDTIHVIKALDNIESRLSNVQDGDFLVVTFPAYLASQEVERFAQQLHKRVEEIRRHTKRQFGVLLLVEGVTVDVVRKHTDREYWRLAKAQVAMQTELNELKAEVAKLIKKGEAK